MQSQLRHSTNLCGHIFSASKCVYVWIVMWQIKPEHTFALITKNEADIRISLTSKPIEPFLSVSKASNRKCAYILESANVETYSNPCALETWSKVFGQLGLAAN